MKRTGTLLLAMVTVFMLVIVPASAISSLNNFGKVNTYVNGQFTDVSSGAWYSDAVAGAYEYGLMKGNSAADGTTYFNAEGTLTIAETITLASRIYSTYYNDGASFEQGAVWYQVYVDYALKNGIVSYAYTDYNEPITRGEFAKILSKALPASALEEINEIEDGGVPDVPANAGYYDSVYLLYRAGILKGNDAKGTFTPQNSIQRSEVAAIVTRMVDKDRRVSVTLTKPDKMSASEIYGQCASSVFYIELYDVNGSFVAGGSGFFIDSAGTAVTNYHVIEKAASGKIVVNSGKEYNIAGVYDYDESQDIALLKIDGSGFDYLSLGDSENLLTGDKIYTIGSPLGLEDTFADGIISNARRIVDGIQFIQFTAPISKGSSGGALINEYGQAIGITSATYSEGQNLNLAVPVHMINGLKKGAVNKLPGSSVLPSTVITADASSITVKQGESKVVKLTVADSGVKLTYSIKDTSVVKCSWGKWDGMTIPLTITGIGSGSTTVTVYSGTHTSNKVTLNVSVPSSGNNYKGTNVPDYNKVTGRSLKRVDTSDGYNHYVYTYNSGEFSAYRNYLTNNGWNYYSGKSDDDYIAYYYSKGSELVGVCRIYNSGEVWIQVKK